uniref:NAC6 n=1 Tax=Liquidambar formosana TaxID=63359 RepID=A0A8T8BE67_LIQFO|nr:NAC6 [Liquidambar formosana]
MTHLLSHFNQSKTQILDTMWNSPGKKSPIVPPQEDPNWAPGWKFNPTDEEIVDFYLKGLNSNGFFLNNMIKFIDLKDNHPEKIHENHSHNGLGIWYFYTQRVPTGNPSLQAGKEGYWMGLKNPTNILIKGRIVGSKKEFTFYKGDFVHSIETKWRVIEYTLSRAPGAIERVLLKIYMKGN